MTRKIIPAIIAAGLLFVGCSSGSNSSDNSNWRDNCISEDKYPQAKRPLLFDEAYTCWKSDGDTITVIFTFSDTNEKQTWQKLAEADGVEVTNDGTDWVEVTPESLFQAGTND